MAAGLHPIISGFLRALRQSPPRNHLEVDGAPPEPAERSFLFPARSFLGTLVRWQPLQALNDKGTWAALLRADRGSALPFLPEVSWAPRDTLLRVGVGECAAGPGQ